MVEVEASTGGISTLEPVGWSCPQGRVGGSRCRPLLTLGYLQGWGVMEGATTSFARPPPTSCPLHRLLNTITTTIISWRPKG